MQIALEIVQRLNLDGWARFPLNNKFAFSVRAIMNILSQISNAYLFAFLIIMGCSSTPVCNLPPIAVFSQTEHPDAIADTIVKYINAAHKQVLMQAYGFTDPSICDALIARWNSDSVDVAVILDHSNETSSDSQMRRLMHLGVPVRIDNVKSIAHNKILIIDSTWVLTGSYNYTERAKKNEENLEINNCPDLALQYINNWNDRENKSRRPHRAHSG